LSVVVIAPAFFVSMTAGSAGRPVDFFFVRSSCLRDFVVTVASRYHPTMRGATLQMVVLAVALAGGQAAAPKDPFPESAGKPALLKVCGNCHTPETVIQSLKTRQEWSDVIDQMARFGAEGSDQEFDQILSYLSRHFSPIKVNNATAKDLESALDVPAAVAEAIVAHRAKNGDFKTLEDLKSVPGLEADRLEAQKARIVF
jgi:competence protein ComEA